MDPASGFDPTRSHSLLRATDTSTSNIQDPWEDIEDFVKEALEPLSQRIEKALLAWNNAGGKGNTKLSMTKAARKNGILPSTLQDRINGAKSRVEQHEEMQRLFPEEEQALVL